MKPKPLRDQVSPMPTARTEWRAQWWLLEGPRCPETHVTGVLRGPNQWPGVALEHLQDQ